MKSLQTAFVVLALCTGAMAVDPEPAKPAPGAPAVVKPAQSWNGSVKNEDAMTKVAHVVTDQAKLAEVWKTCERTDAVPEIDFTTNFVAVETSRGSHVNVTGGRLKDGDLGVIALATRDLRPGFRYIIAVFPREGVKSVNGTKISE